MTDVDNLVMNNFMPGHYINANQDNAILGRDSI